MRFYLKTFAIGFEIPFYDSQDKTGVNELAASVANSYLSCVDSLESSMSTIDTSTGNTILLYTLVVRVDMDLANPDEFQADWNRMKSNIEQAFDTYLKQRNLEYRIIKQKED